MKNNEAGTQQKLRAGFFSISAYIDIFDSKAIIESINRFECEVKRMVSEYAANAKVFKAFCDENRLRILELLQSGEKCACILLDDLQISQPTLSHHMRILCDSGVVSSRKDGKWVHYSIDPQGAVHAMQLLKQQLTLDI